MTVLDQSRFKTPYRHPGYTYFKRPRLRIKRTKDGWVWMSKKKKAITKPAPTKREAKNLAKIKLRAIKARKRKKPRTSRS